MTGNMCSDARTLLQTFPARGLHIGSLIDSFLGPCKSLKYIVDDADTVLTCCPLLLLRTVSQSCPFEHLLEEVLCSHHEQYGCNNITLIAMWYFWEQELKVLINEGIEPCYIFSCVQACIQHVVMLLPVIEVPVGKLFRLLEPSPLKISFSNTSDSLVSTSGRTVPLCRNSELSKPKSFYHSRSLKSKNSLIGNQSMSYGVMIRSRHFSPSSKIPEDVPASLCDTVCNNTQVEEVELTQVDKIALHKIVKQLCHTDFGHNDLISKLWEHQVMYSNTVKFSTDFVGVFPTVGPSSNSCVIDGLLIEISGKESFVSQHNSVHNYKALLISGDATPDYKHLGFASTAVIEMCKSVEDMSRTSADTWVNDCINLILKLEVSLLLVRGSVHSSLMEACISKSVDVISHIPLQSFKIISRAFHMSPCSYILGCNEKSVVDSISLHPWCTNTEASLLNNNEFYVVKTYDKISKHFLQTVVLSHPCRATLSLYEHQFWHAASCLVLACHSKSVLPGGGMTEKWCCQTILELASNKQGEEAKILQALAAGFSRYQRTVSEKTLLYKNEPCNSLDEKESKVQAWHSAISLLATVLVDSCIINGYEASHWLYNSLTEKILQCL